MLGAATIQFSGVGRRLSRFARVFATTAVTVVPFVFAACRRVVRLRIGHHRATNSKVSGEGRETALNQELALLRTSRRISAMDVVGVDGRAA